MMHYALQLFNWGKNSSVNIEICRYIDDILFCITRTYRQLEILKFNNFKSTQNSRFLWAADKDKTNNK